MWWRLVRLFFHYFCCMFAVCLRPVDHLSICCHWCLADKMLEYVRCSTKVCKSTWCTSKTGFVNHIECSCRVLFTVNTLDVMFYELMIQNDAGNTEIYIYTCAYGQRWASEGACAVQSELRHKQFVPFEWYLQVLVTFCCDTGELLLWWFACTCIMEYWYQFSTLQQNVVLCIGWP